MPCRACHLHGLTCLPKCSALLRVVKDDDIARDLVPLARGRAAPTLVIRKVLSGMISRAGWLSYVAEQPWSSRVKVGLGALDHKALGRLLEALLSEDYNTVAGLSI